MRRLAATSLLGLLAIAWPTAAGSAPAAQLRGPSAAATATTWGAWKATGTLNAGKLGLGEGISCSMAADCWVVGSYRDAGQRTQAFAAELYAQDLQYSIHPEALGTTLNVGGEAHLKTISCSVPWDCAAGGAYAGAGHRLATAFANLEAFVALRRWTGWEEYRLASGLNAGGLAEVTATACPGQAFRCFAAGYLHDADGHGQAFVSAFNPTSSTWADVELAGSLNLGGDAAVTSLSCSSAKACAAVGRYADATGTEQAFAATFDGTTWASTQLAASLGSSAEASSVSCPAAKACVAVGSYLGAQGQRLGFAASFNASSWTAKRVAATKGPLRLVSVSCAKATSCVAGGYQVTGPGQSSPLVLSRSGTAWSAGSTVGIGGNGQVSSVSCASASYCVAAGSSQLSGQVSEVFAATFDGQGWVSEKQLGRSLNAGHLATSTSASCTGQLACGFTGYSMPEAGRTEAFGVFRVAYR